MYCNYKLIKILFILFRIFSLSSSISREPKEVSVTNIEELKIQLADIDSTIDEHRNGIIIRLEEGTYNGNIEIEEGLGGFSLGAPILIAGSNMEDVIFKGEGDGPVFSFTNITNIDIWNITIDSPSSKIGILVRNSNFSTLTKITVKNVKETGIAIKDDSFKIVVVNCTFSNIGDEKEFKGVGVSIGSDKDDWTTPDRPDDSFSNNLIYNEFGPDITGAHIEIKEGVFYTYVSKNKFDGRGMSNPIGENGSWVYIKGSNSDFFKNVGMYSENPLGSGFSIKIVDDVGVARSGCNNKFYLNKCDLRIMKPHNRFVRNEGLCIREIDVGCGNSDLILTNTFENALNLTNIDIPPPKKENTNGEIED